MASKKGKLVTVLRVFIFISFLISETFAIYGFEDEEGSCSLVLFAAGTGIEAVTEKCSDVRSQCPGTNKCICTSIPDNSVVATCVDKCTYSYGSLTVEQSFGASRSLNALAGEYVVANVYTFSIGFVAGGTGSYRVNVFQPAFFKTCEGDLNGCKYPCEPVYCDKNKEIVNYQVDCSGSPDGIFIDYCKFPKVEVRDNLTIMEIHLFIPAIACNESSIQFPRPPSTTTTITPTIGTIKTNKPQKGSTNQPQSFPMPLPSSPSINLRNPTIPKTNYFRFIKAFKKFIKYMKILLFNK